MSNDVSIASLQKRIDDINQQAWDCRVQDSERAFALAEESVKLSREINYSRGLAEGLRSLGFAYVRLFKNEMAAPLLQESLALFQSLNDLNGQAIVYEYLGITQRNWGNLGLSLELLLKGNAMIPPSAFPEIEITSCYQIGVTYKHLGDHDNALDYLYRSLSLAQQIGMTLMVAYATNIIGSIYFDNGEYEKALECYQKGLTIRRDSHDKWGEAGSLDNIGFTYLKLNQLDKAIDYCQQSLSISQNTGDKKGEANAMLHLAEIYQKAGDVLEAGKFSNKSLQIRRSRGDKRGEAEVLIFLAELYGNNEEVYGHQVLEWLSEALKIAGEIKAQDIISKSYYNLYQHYSNKGQFKESLEHLTLHLQIERELHKNAITQKVSNLEVAHKAAIITQRNKELTELNEQIAIANAELKIEASLERVRAVTMSMSRPEDVLNICKVMFAELQVLGFKDVRNALINFWDDDNHLLHDYDYSDFSGGNFAKLFYSSHPVFEAFQKKVRAAVDAFAELVVSKDELETWKQRRRDSGEYDDPRLNNISALYYYFYSTGVGALGISTFSPIPKEKVEILKRFRNVFDLTYRRYLDIVKAEAQAREAQIEAALERVRARTMAMHKSDEVTAVAVTLSEELLKLGFSGGSTIIIMDKETGDTEQWTGFSEDKTLRSCYVPYFKHPYHDSLFAAWKKGDSFFVYTIKGDEKISLDQHYFSTGYKIFPENDKKWMKDMKSVTFSHAFMKYGTIHWGPDHLTEEQLRILQRFSKVFEQAYTRFLDLQKAEAQAREAEIELGLERVRARAMAMQRSDELSDLVNTVFKELTKLDFALNWCIINIIDEPSLTNTVWAANPDIDKAPESYRMKFEDYPFHHAMLKGYRERMAKCVYTLEGDEKKIYDEYLFNETEFRRVPAEAQAASRAMERYVVTFTFSNFGGLQTVSNTPLSDASIDILSRFGKVFDLTYTRFNDLQKAEAQAREAKIEAALEKIRSRSLAMHHSDELREVIGVTHQMFKEIKVKHDTIAIQVFDFENKSSVFWPGNSLSDVAPKVMLPFDHQMMNADTCHRDLWQAMNTGEAIINKVYTRQQKDRWFEYVFAHNNTHVIDEHAREFILKAEMHTVCFFPEKNSGMFADSWDGSQYCEEDLNIIKRAGRVFEQAYVRFLDLQTAEAQARESQIQLALERVRARTMAIQKSDELREVIALLFVQIKGLGFDAFMCSITLPDKATRGHRQITSSLTQAVLPQIYNVPYIEDAFFDKFMASFDEGVSYRVFELGGIEKKELDKKYFTFSDYKFLPEESKQMMLNTERCSLCCAYMTHGCIAAIGDHELNAEQANILQRFAKVFEQTYTRFLDLQKAEAQAKEAQVEAALERVRARAMAMHTSEQLIEVVRELRKQIVMLGQEELDTCVIQLYEESEEYIHAWASMTTSKDNRDIYDFERRLVPKRGLLIQEEILKAYNEGRKDYTILNEKEKLKQWLNFMKESFPDAYVVIKEFYQGSNPEDVPVFWSLSDFNGGSLLMITAVPPADDSKKLLKRFAKVFGLAYRRFIDLKKAEAQARESQIQLALERVRSRAMAMQTSDELNELIGTVFTELTKLDLVLTRCIIWVFDPVTNSPKWWMANSEEPSKPMNFVIKYHEHPAFLTFLREWKNQNVRFVYDLKGEDKISWDKILFNETELANLPDVVKVGMQSPERVLLSCSFNNFGGINVASLEPLSDEHFDILLRFAKVFDLTYTRFNDLKQAEAQARESQIQLALERVRARTMAMQKSEELPETSHILFEQMKELGEPVEQLTIGVVQEEDRVVEISATLHGDTLKKVYRHSIDEPFMMSKVYHAWKTQQKTVTVELKGNELNAYNQYRNELTRSEMFPTDLGDEHRRIVYAAFFSKGMLALGANEPRPAESLQLLERFAGVFDQAYIRFIDLQKAEAQARESQIQLALERVRARTMAMHKSDELAEVVALLYRQFEELDFGLYQILISIFKPEENCIEWWSRGFGDTDLPQRNIIPFIEHPLPDMQLKNWRNGETYYAHILGGELKKSWEDYLFTQTDLRNFPDEVKNVMRSIDQVYLSDAFMKYGVLQAAGPEPLSNDKSEILIRFAKVLDQAYTRMMDLQKAEAQAREAQIEAALERVRSASLAMHRSEELEQVIVSLFERYQELGVPFHGAAIYVFDKAKRDLHLWVASKITAPVKVNLPHDPDIADNQIHMDLWRAIEDGTDVLNRVYSGKVKNDYFSYVNKYNGDESIIPLQVQQMMLDAESWTASFVAEKNCLVGIDSFSGNLTSNEDFQIVKRFARVFEQAYTRFLDLQKAEAQAREAQIEAALERVRSKTMAMQKSEELNDLINIFYSELNRLELSLNRCFIMTFDPKTLDATWWMASGDEISYNTGLLVPYHTHPPQLGYINGWREEKERWSYLLEGSEKEEWDKFLLTETGLATLPDIVKDGMRNVERAFISASFKSFGCLTTGSHDPLSDEAFEILIRFTKVFEQSYTRFLDLQKAEAQAKEAKIEAALERVRSRTLAMQKSDELAETAAVMFQQLIHLGIEPNRLYIILLKEETGDMEAWVTDEDGSKINRGFNGNFNKNETLHKMYTGWKQQHKTLVIDMQGEELQNYFHYLHDELKVPFKGGMEQKRRVQHIAYFSKGLIGIASPEPQPVETMQLLERFAAVFNLTYTRFNDLKIAEAHALQAEQDLIAIKEAKQKAEDALVELQATQKQLIQTEKMASLGELTAGIAHEIQNPLNFVNNFSDVSNELLEEMKQELDLGNTASAKAIAKDVKENLEKILHHGKRADAIVKGMLQHSRTSSGVKEATDINDLADEYIRLAYHGLRAKDKSFNAKFETHFDPDIQKINVIPQDIGRVILNLINNAFYTVNEKRKQVQNGYEPIVTISTKKMNHTIEIIVKDNGNGIPKKVLDKIFQPFFTTKPTGQGTGLGLSLSYDIITKGHGGEINVTTDEGKGAEFIISLPIN